MNYIGWHDKKARVILNNMHKRSSFKVGEYPKWESPNKDDDPIWHIYDKKRSRHAAYFGKTFGYNYTEPWLSKY